VKRSNANLAKACEPDPAALDGAVLHRVIPIACELTGCCCKVHFGQAPRSAIYQLYGVSRFAVFCCWACLRLVSRLTSLHLWHSWQPTTTPAHAGVLHISSAGVCSDNGLSQAKHLSVGADVVNDFGRYWSPSAQWRIEPNAISTGWLAAYIPKITQCPHSTVQRTFFSSMLCNSIYIQAGNQQVAK
jgi:hypothetical protein